MYASNALSSVLKQDIQSVERIQQRYTKAIYNSSFMSYADRLGAFKVLSLEDMGVVSGLAF